MMYSSVSLRTDLRTALAIAMAAGGACLASTAQAQAAPRNLVSACSGVSLPRSVVTGIVAPVVNGIVAPTENRINGILGRLGGLPVIPTLNIDTTTLLADAAVGDPITLQAIARDGTVVGPDDRCDLQADSLGLNTQGGIALGGNIITGLGTNGLDATAGTASAIALGNGAQTGATANGAVALGTNARASAANGIALGANSVSARGALTGYAALGLAAPQASAGELSVGAAGAERQITNVAAGSAATDAVNVGQLGGVDARVTTTATAVTNLTLDVGNGAVGPVRYANPLTPTVPNGGTPTNDLTLVGAAAAPVGLHNVRAGVVAAGSTDAVNGDQLNTLGYDVAALGGLAVQYDDTTHRRVTLGGNGAAAVRLGNVAAGTLGAGSTEAVNGAQLARLGDDTAAALGGNSHYDPGTNSLATTLTYNGQQFASVQAAFDAVDSASADTRYFHANSTGAAAVASGAESVAIGPVAVASADNSAAIGAGSIAARGATAGYAATGLALPQSSAGEVSVGAPGADRQITNVAAGATATDAVNVAQLQGVASQLATLGGRAVQYDGPTRTSITLGGVGGTTLTNVRAGAVTAASTDAVTGAQLFATNAQVANNTTAITNLSNQIQTSNTNASGSNRYFHTNSTMADSQAAGMNSTAVGGNAVSSGQSSIAVGNTALASGDQSVAIGVNATAMNGKAVSIGMGNMASGDGAVSIGDPNVATGDGAAALGKDNTATGIGAVALGNTNSALDDGAVALGNQNGATGSGAVAIGASNVSNGVGAIAIGTNNNAAGDNSLAIGSGVRTVATDTLAIGSNAVASAVSAVAVGNRAAATGANSLSVGTGTRASGLQSSAFGAQATASGGYATAVGQNTTASGAFAVTFGVGAVANGTSAAAIGSGAAANTDYSVALGSASNASRGGQARYAAFGVTGPQSSLGEVAIARSIGFVNPITGVTQPTGLRQITGLAAGSADTDAVNVAQLRGVSTTLGTEFASGLGGGASYDSATGGLIGPSYTFGGVTYGNVGDALQALAANGTGGATGGGAANPVTYTDASHGTINLAPGGTQVHDVAAGAVTANSSDAVNGSQLEAVSRQLSSTQAAVASLTTDITDGAIGTVQYSSAATPTRPNGGTASNDLTLVGAVPTQAVGLHNVAAAAVAAGSTDAVNGGQLYATNQAVTTAQATANGALALGQNSVQYDGASHSNVTLGDGGGPVALHNIAPGVSPTDAVNVAQLGAGMGSAISQSNDYTDSRIAAVTYDIRKAAKRADAGTAGALAAVGLPQAYTAGKGMLAMAMGQYGSQTAFAVGMSKAMLDGHTVVKLSGTYDTRSRAGASAGVGYQF